MSSFFLGNRNFGWFLAGTSMVATTFAADTPLAVTELVSANGISGNWLWWNFLFGGMLTTFFFARLWRRANVLTEVEFIELRYSGKEAAFLRAFRAGYLGIFMNAMIIGWVNIAMMTILEVFFGIPRSEAIWYTAGLMLLTAGYSSLSGLIGVAVTDVVQFFIAMIGCIILAYKVLDLDKIGGIDGLKEKLPASTFEFFPQIGEMNTAADVGGALTITVGAFLAYISIQWWASWYPGAEPGGGGYVAQRMMSTKDEKNSIYATLYFQVAHYCLRPWPWIIVGLCTIVLYPELSADDKKFGYVLAMRDHLPVGLKGLLLVAFLAAYMSTIATQLNWGTSYIINDIYHRFVNKNASDKTLVKASRLGTLLTMLIGLAVTTQITTISGVWQFIIECGAGLGLVLILRWYWWRINAWSEIVATIAPFVAYAVCRFGLKIEFPNSFFITVGFTTITWLIVTFLTQPTQKEKLETFYAKIKPQGAWEPIRIGLGIEKPENKLPNLIVCWLSAIVFTYSVLFFTGKLIFKEWNEVAIWGSTAIVALLVLRHFAAKTKIFQD